MFRDEGSGDDDDEARQERRSTGNLLVERKRAAERSEEDFLSLMGFIWVLSFFAQGERHSFRPPSTFFLWNNNNFCIHIIRPGRGGSHGQEEKV